MSRLIDRYVVKRNGVYHLFLPYIAKIEGREVSIEEMKETTVENRKLQPDSIAAINEFKSYYDVLYLVKSTLKKGKTTIIKIPSTYNILLRFQTLLWLVDGISLSFDKDTIVVNSKDEYGNWTRKTNTYQSVKLI
jgi:hypothetical protein